MEKQMIALSIGDASDPENFPLALSNMILLLTPWEKLQS